jgi:hypothetical protein
LSSRLSLPEAIGLSLCGGLASLGGGECDSTVSTDEMTECIALSAKPIKLFVVGSPASTSCQLISCLQPASRSIRACAGHSRRQAGPSALGLLAPSCASMLEKTDDLKLPTNCSSAGEIRAVGSLGTIPFGRSLGTGDIVMSPMPGLRLILTSRSALQHSKSGQGAPRRNLSVPLTGDTNHPSRRMDAHCEFKPPPVQDARTSATKRVGGGREVVAHSHYRLVS